MEPKVCSLVLANGSRVGVIRIGSGVPLVFFHGFSVRAYAYLEMLMLLADRGYEVIALDAADHGSSDPLPIGHSILDMADVAAEAVKMLGVSDAVVVGHSMGGAIALELAVAYPELTSQLILLDAAVGPYNYLKTPGSNRFNIIRKAASFAVGAIRDVVSDVYTAQSLRRFQERLDLGSRLKDSVSGIACLRAVYALLIEDTMPLLEKLRINQTLTHIVHGTDDQIIPLSAAKVAAQVSGAVLVRVEKGAHSWMISDPMRAVTIVDSVIR